MIEVVGKTVKELREQLAAFRDDDPAEVVLPLYNSEQPGVFTNGVQSLVKGLDADTQRAIINQHKAVRTKVREAIARVRKAQEPEDSDEDEGGE